MQTRFTDMLAMILFYGGRGDDLIVGGLGNDMMDGQGGEDTIVV